MQKRKFEKKIKELGEELELKAVTSKEIRNTRQLERLERKYHIRIKTVKVFEELKQRVGAIAVTQKTAEEKRQIQVKAICFPKIKRQFHRELYQERERSEDDKPGAEELNKFRWSIQDQSLQ